MKKPGVKKPGVGRPSKATGFTGTPGRPSMKVRGWDGTDAGKQRIQELWEPKKGTWSMVSAAAACDRSLSQASAFTVLALLGKYRNPKTGECFPSVVRLSEDLGISRRTVQRHLDRLVERGYLVVLPRRVKINSAGSRQTSNTYVVLFPPMPEAHGGEEGCEYEETPDLPPNPLDGLPMASATSATDDVAAGGGTPPSQGQKDESPLRQMVTTPATDRDKPCDAVCRSNAPTINDPILDGPSAEAGTLARAAAVADEGGGKIGKGKPSTETGAPTQNEANQEGAVAKLPPRLASHLRVLSKTTGKTEAEFMAVIGEWHSGLIDRGFDTGLALDRIVSEARRIPATAYAMENLRDGMARDLQARRAAA